MAAAKKAARKTTKNRGGVTAFLDTVKNEARRDDCHALVAIMQRASGQPPAMWGEYIVGFGSYRYTLASGAEEDAPAIAFSPRSTKIALYHMDLEAPKQLLARLGKYATGKKCMYVTRLSDVDVGALEELCARSYAGVVAKASKASK